jgi:hypothetical protein
MSVKLITSNARKLFDDRIALGQILRNQSFDPIFKEKAAQEIETFEQCFQTEWWQSRHTNPVWLNFTGQFVHQLVKTRKEGIFVLYKDCIYLVSGPYTPR